MGYLFVLIGDEVAGRRITIQSSKEFDRHPPVRSPAAILVNDVEEDEALKLRSGFAALGHVRSYRLRCCKDILCGA